MAIGTKQMFGPRSQFNGAYEEENWELTGDGAATSVVITSQILRDVDMAWGTPAVNNVINNAGLQPTVTLTFAAAIANGAKVFLKLRGTSR